MFSHDTLQSLFAKPVQTDKMHQYRNVHPKDTSRMRPPYSRGLGTAPASCYRYQLEIFRECVQLSFGKSPQISASYLQLFPRYSRKTWRVDENNPLPLIGLSTTDNPAGHERERSGIGLFKIWRIYEDSMSLKAWISSEKNRTVRKTRIYDQLNNFIWRTEGDTLHLICKRLRCPILSTTVLSWMTFDQLTNRLNYRRERSSRVKFVFIGA